MTQTGAASYGPCSHKRPIHMGLNSSSVYWPRLLKELSYRNAYPIELFLCFVFVLTIWLHPTRSQHNSSSLHDFVQTFASALLGEGRQQRLSRRGGGGGMVSQRGILVGKVQCLFPNQNLLKSILQPVYSSVSYYLTMYMMKVCKGNLNFYSRCLGLNFRDSWCPGIAVPKIQFFSVSSLLIRTMVTNISILW